MRWPRVVRRALAWRRMRSTQDDYLVQECVALLVAQNAGLRAARDRKRPTRMTAESKVIVIRSVCGVLLAFTIIWGVVAVVEHYGLLGFFSP